MLYLLCVIFAIGICYFGYKLYGKKKNEKDVKK